MQVANPYRRRAIRTLGPACAANKQRDVIRRRQILVIAVGTGNLAEVDMWRCLNWDISGELRTD